ncbi:hypothetical protein CPC16_004435 [Podila verticillata]|nr:hypothetical protein BGZ52_011057 [Haplosporangium bisporale]KAF9211420.1 hypothetical protein BGZ59_008118 [Podila verticillata]KAF9391324.1 hypothetical protein CPC16_004435 [Podila verticillata]KFH64065.1 hypothetical protein MVEG_09890 [Podila verticillata NRRL 6337]
MSNTYPSSRKRVNSCSSYSCNTSTSLIASSPSPSPPSPSEHRAKRSPLTDMSTASHMNSAIDTYLDPRYTVPYEPTSIASEQIPIESTALSETASTNVIVITVLNQLPSEILGIIQSNFTNPCDLLYYSHTCRLFYQIVDAWAWFRLYKAQLPRWSLHVQFDYLSDPNEWKVLVLEDYLKKQGPWSARSSRAAALTNLSTPIAPTNIASSVSAAQQALDTQLLSPPHFAQTMHAVLPSITSCTTTASISTLPTTVTSTTATVTSSTATDQPTMLMQPNLSAEYEQVTPTSSSSPQPHEEITETIDSRLFVNLDDAQHIRSNSMAPQGWQNVGPPVSSTHKPSGRTLAAYIQSHSYNTETDYRIVLYTLPDHDTPVAILSSEYWYSLEDEQLLWHTQPEGAPNVAQVMDIMYFPDQRDNQGRARVLIALAFGQGSGPLSEISDDNNILDVWMLIKVLEVHIPDTLPPSTLPAHVIAAPFQQPLPRLIRGQPDPDKGRVVNIVPIRRQPMEMIRGRMVKLYTTADPATGTDKDCIALFGILHEVTSPSLTSPAIVVKGALFDPSPEWKFQEAKSQIRASASCMALFPPYSEFEQLMVVFYPHGQGEIWNWHEMKIVACLGTKSQEELDLAHQKAKKLVADGGKVVDNYLSNDGRDHDARGIVQLYCWGVHVVHAVEGPGQQYEGKTTSGRGDFRVVTMADGADKEWESCWWHVKGSILRKYLGNSNESTTTSDPKSTLDQEAFERLIGYSSRHYESWTLGRAVKPRERQRIMPPTNMFGQPSHASIPYGVASTPDQPSRPDKHLLFIAYLVWEHYRISLTSQYGLCLVDMDQETTGDYLGDELQKKMTLTQNKQLVTFLDDAASDPLVDIATVGNALFITRKFSHMVWPLRRRLGIQLRH